MNFWEIYDDHYLRVRKFILAVVRDEWAADDICQETFFRVQSSMDSLKDPARISSWIFRIAYNLCQDHFRNLKAASLRAVAEKKNIRACQQPAFQKELEQREMTQCVQDQISLLPESLRTVIVLFDMMDCTHQEIADILGITVQNVKVRLHRARKKLKTILEEKCTFEVDERSVLTCEASSRSNS